MDFRYSDSHRTKKKLSEYRTSYLLKSAATVPDVIGIPLIPENVTIAGLPAFAGVPGVVDAAVVVFVLLLLAFLELLALPLLHGVPAFAITFSSLLILVVFTYCTVLYNETY
jgi:hypothetical protein